MNSPTTAAPSSLVLPSGRVTISDCAKELFLRIAPHQKMFWYGGAVVEPIDQTGTITLSVVKPEAFRSRAERYGWLVVWRAGANGELVLKPTKMPRDDAAALMAAAEAREILPPIASVLRCPVLVESGEGVKVLSRGYHRELGGLLIVAGEEPPKVPLEEAVALLKWAIEQFDFQSEGDQSRALAAFITPALRMGGLLKTNAPIDVGEADKSQAGKGHRAEMVCAIYNESSYFVTVRSGGVGSADESFAAALIAGRPFISLDNLRGKINSQHLEAFLTCSSLFPARVPHCPEVLVNPKKFLLQMTSNGLEATRDLANRASICRIRKRQGFLYRDTLGEIQRRQAHFLGCVFAVVTEWIARGKPCTAETRRKRWTGFASTSSEPRP